MQASSDSERWRKRSASRSMPASAIRSGMPSRNSSSGAASASGLTKSERPPGLELQRDEAELLLVDPALPVSARRGDEAAVEAVRPGVVRALERLAPARALADERAAVAADVEERAERVLLVAHEHDGDVADRASRRTIPARARRPRGRRTATSGGRCARARAGARPGPCTSSTAGVLTSTALTRANATRGHPKRWVASRRDER